MNFDRWASDFVQQLLERGGLELTTASSRDTVETRVAFILESGILTPSKIAAQLLEMNGVAELEADDELIAKLLEETKTTTEDTYEGDEAPTFAKPKPPVQSLDVARFDPAARAAVVRAQELADEMRCPEATSKHLLAAMLEDEGLVAIATNNGGKPDRKALLAGMSKGAGSPEPAILSSGLLRILEEAKESAPNVVRLSDLALAGVHVDDASFRAAFKAPRAPIPLRREEPEDSDDDDEGRALTLSDELRDAFKLACAISREDREAWPKRETRPAVLRARDVEAAERELETSLPDDFWAAAAAAIEPFAALGIARVPPHDDPAPIAEAWSYVLETASDADGFVDDDLVAIIELPDDGYVCVKKGVSWAKRNERPVILVRNDERREALFGPLLLELMREHHGNVKLDANAPTFTPRVA